MAKNGIAIRYIDVNDASYLFRQATTVETHVPVQPNPTAGSTELSSHPMQFSLSWYSPSEQKFVVSTASRLIEWALRLNNDTLLILDNCDDFLQGNQTQQCAFKEVIKRLHEASKYLRIIITSRVKIKVIGGSRCYYLKQLENHSAIELLQYDSSILTTSESRKIAELVDNNPLALRIAAHLVSEVFQPQMVVSELTHNPINLLSPDAFPESQKILPIFYLSYHYLNTSTRLCAHYLSHFPGSFDKQAGVSILSMSSISNPESCIEKLNDRSLLEIRVHAGKLRCYFHRLIKEFLHYMQLKQIITGIEMLQLEYSSNFLLYYSSVLVNFTEHENPNSIKDKVQCDIHNFREVFLLMKKDTFDWLLTLQRSVINVCRSLSSDLILEVFSANELVNFIQTLISLFDKKFHAIWKDIGGSETLSLYMGLFLQAKKQLRSLRDDGLNSKCFALCEELFDNDLHIGRIKIIQELLLTNAEELQHLFFNLDVLDSYFHSWTCRYDCSYFKNFLYTPWCDLNTGLERLMNFIYTAWIESQIGMVLLILPLYYILCHKHYCSTLIVEIRIVLMLITLLSAINLGIFFFLVVSPPNNYIFNYTVIVLLSLVLIWICLLVCPKVHITCLLLCAITVTLANFMLLYYFSSLLEIYYCYSLLIFLDTASSASLLIFFITIVHLLLFRKLANIA